MTTRIALPHANKHISAIEAEIKKYRHITLLRIGELGIDISTPRHYPQKEILTLERELREIIKTNNHVR